MNIVKSKSTLEIAERRYNSFDRTTDCDVFHIDPDALSDLFQDLIKTKHAPPIHALEDTSRAFDSFAKNVSNEMPRGRVTAIKDTINYVFSGLGDARMEAHQRLNDILEAGM